ncbi:hypothetical protein ACLOJK_030710 [Asimina triloba]
MGIACTPIIVYCQSTSFGAPSSSSWLPAEPITGERPKGRFKPSKSKAASMFFKSGSSYSKSSMRAAVAARRLPRIHLLPIGIDSSMRWPTVSMAAWAIASSPLVNDISSQIRRHPHHLMVHLHRRSHLAINSLNQLAEISHCKLKICNSGRKSICGTSRAFRQMAMANNAVISSDLVLPQIMIDHGNRHANPNLHRSSDIANHSKKWTTRIGNYIYHRRPSDLEAAS